MFEFIFFRVNNSHYYKNGNDLLHETFTCNIHYGVLGNQSNNNTLITKIIWSNSWEYIVHVKNMNKKEINELHGTLICWAIMISLVNHGYHNGKC